MARPKAGCSQAASVEGRTSSIAADCDPLTRNAPLVATTRTHAHKDVYAVKAIGHTNLLSASGNTVAIAECRPTRTCLVKRRWREKNRGWNATARRELT